MSAAIHLQTVDLLQLQIADLMYVLLSRIIILQMSMLSVTSIKNMVQTLDASCYYKEHQKNNNRRTYLFYDNVHLVKNTMNNLLNVNKYVFPAF